MSPVSKLTEIEMKALKSEKRKRQNLNRRLRKAQIAADASKVTIKPSAEDSAQVVKTSAPSVSFPSNKGLKN